MSARVHGLRVEHRRTGLGTPACPRLSWRFDGDSVEQVGYDVRVRGDRSDTITVDGDEHVLVAWPFAPLTSRERVAASVRAHLADGTTTAWSDPIVIEAALLDRDDWVEPIVTPSPTAPPELPRPGYVLRATFEIAEPVARARLYTTALGIFRAHLNGDRIGDSELAPGWTSYRHRVLYETHDVTDRLLAGENTIGFELADGWYRGRLGFHGGLWDLYGPQVGVLAQLELLTTDGRRRVVPLSDAWRCSHGPVASASLYDGESYDARAEPDGWTAPGFDDGTWWPAQQQPLDGFEFDLVPPAADPVRVVERLHPVSVEHRASGRIRLDFGQNISGRLEIRPRGTAGHRIRLHHAEVIEDDELGTRPLRQAASVDEYVLRGDPEGETWSPAFTIHGFRYTEIEGWPGEFDSDQVDALVVHSDMERAGWFECSEPLLNQLHENTVWSMRDNFVHLPTDCPQRDERLGWTGDIQVFAPAAAFLYHCSGVLNDWLADLVAEQRPDGHVPNFVPWVPCGFPEPASAAWGDAAVIVPWVLYERTGDVAVLERHFASMRAWIRHLAAHRAGAMIEDGFQLGDWLDPAAPPDRPGDGQTDRYLVANAYLIRSARLAAATAEVLDRPGHAAELHELAERTLVAFRQRYIGGDGVIVGESATALALAIMFELFATDDARQAAGRRLADLVERGQYRIQTGFVGTPLICDALADTGQVDHAHRLLLERDCPSWLYPVTMGATTIWERWDSMLPDGSINPGEMTSFNHYALGAVVDFMHRVVAGLAPAEPGYRTIRVAPQPGRMLDRASARHDTPYGVAEVSWQRTGRQFVVDVELPPGTTGRVVLPDSGCTALEVDAGHHRLTCELDEPDAVATPAGPREPSR